MCHQHVLFIAALVSALVLVPYAGAQAPKNTVPPDAPPPPLTYRGLIPGLDLAPKVREVLGEPQFAARWYNYKMYYPSVGRPDMVDVVHMTGPEDTARLASIEAASVPEGYETDAAIRTKLGEPEYELRMATWTLLDYSEQGLRFSLTADGKTTGVAYVPHTHRRVPRGERALMDLSHLREGPQPRPAKPADLGGLEAGVAEVVISPQEASWLPYPFVVHDDMKARIIVFRRGELSVALVGADLFGMTYPDVVKIREAVHALGVDHTILAMSHNHAGPDTIGVYGHYPVEHIAFIHGRIVAGVKEALGAMKPVGEIRAIAKELPMDGTRVIHLIRNARNPGVMDPAVAVMQVLDTEGGVMATLVHFACHAESIEPGPREITADFPGYMCEQIRKDGGGQAIFLNGALGGMVSGDNPERTHESSREMGLKLAAIVNDLVKDAQPPATFAFSVDQRPLEIPVTNPEFQAMFTSGARPSNRGRVITDMIYFRLGEAQFITLPGELLPEVSFEILEAMEGYPRLLIGLGNDELGYMVPPYDFRSDSYEESMSCGPATALCVRDMALRMLAGR